ncbi:hypothetical protein TUBRATIS_24200 [Tubulinosema ratisbonensis]|uniref:Uncharacterized protein n=1 Tax=Tubulinosema ratisbonensis TaxID=291195 RepID=A0A437AJ87_9MICR|nr:hypothetical protein TUBRATIS_24200 [Tubulinosema ratisbonensis]
MSKYKNETLKNESEDKHLNKTKTNLKNNKIAIIIEYINEFLFFVIISNILLHMNVFFKDLLFFKSYIALRALNIIFSLESFSKYTRIKKVFGFFIMLYDNFIKILYLLITICIDFLYIKITNFYAMHLDQRVILLFYVFTTVLVIYFLAFFYILFLYLKTFYLSSENIKKYFIHSLISKITILSFLYLFLLTYVLYLTPLKTFLFNFYFVSLCYLALSFVIPLFFYKKMCLDRRFFLDILFKFYIKLFCVFLFNCGFLFEFIIASVEKNKIRLFFLEII